MGDRFQIYFTNWCQSSLIHTLVKVKFYHLHEEWKWFSMIDNCWHCLQCPVVVKICSLAIKLNYPALLWHRLTLKSLALESLYHGQITLIYSVVIKVTTDTCTLSSNCYYYWRFRLQQPQITRWRWWIRQMQSWQNRWDPLRRTWAELQRKSFKMILRWVAFIF